MALQPENVRPIHDQNPGEARNRARQQSALAELSQRALHDRDLGALFDDAVGVVAEGLQVRYCDLLEVAPDQSGLVWRAGIGWKEDFSDSAPMPLDRQSQAGYSVLAQRRVVLDDIHAENPYAPTAVLLNHGVVSSLSVPIPGEETAFGVLSAHSAVRRIFTEDEISFVQAVANVIAGAVRMKRIAQDLRRSELYFRSLLESAPDGMAIVDQAGTIILVNLQTEQLFGYSRAELVGQKIEVLVPERYRGYHVRHRREFTHEPRTRPMGVNLDLFGVRKDGSEFPVEISLSPMQTEKGTVVTAAIRDITERKKTEAQIRKLNGQLEEALRRSDRLATTGRLAASIAHEINNPLEALTGALYLLATGHLSADQKALVDAAQRELERVADISRLTLAPHREAKSPTVVNVAELLDAACATFMRKTERAQIEVVKNYEEHVAVSANPGELRQVFTNLVSNAIDVMPAGGRLVLGVGRKSGFAQITVGDTGSGISPENEERIFEPFFSTKGDTGLGLGLWISRKIIDKMGGRIEVQSSTSGEDRGTVFTILLPAIAEPTSEGALDRNERTHS